MSWKLEAKVSGFVPNKSDEPIIISPELRKKVEELVTLLRRSSFKQRRQAKQDLNKLGFGIFSLLESYQQHDDVEIHANIK